MSHRAHRGNPGPDAGRPTSPSGWVLRAVVSAHVVAALGQPVFAGLYLTGDFDGLSRHAAGADVVTTLGYLQLIAAVVVWVRLRRAAPFVAAAAVATAETVQYFAGLEGALWLHVPLGVMIVAALVVQFIAVWLRPVARREAETSDGGPTPAPTASAPGARDERALPGLGAAASAPGAGDE